MMRQIEQKILDFISRFCFEEQRSPTLTEIANGVGYSSRGSVHRYVKSLIDNGYLHSDGGNKNLRCTRKPVNHFSIPLLDKIAAGRPIEAIAKSLELSITHLFAGANRFVLQVIGDSMIDAGIHNNDYIIIQQTNTANNGQIVVAADRQRRSHAKTLLHGL